MADEHVAKKEYKDGKGKAALIEEGPKEAGYAVSGDAASAREVWGALTQENPDDARAKAYLAMLERTSPV